MIWPIPRMPFGPNFWMRLGQTFQPFGPTLGPSFWMRLGLPPINHQPATTTTTNWVKSSVRVTRSRVAQASTPIRWGFSRTRYALPANPEATNAAKARAMQAVRTTTKESTP